MKSPSLALLVALALASLTHVTKVAPQQQNSNTVGGNDVQPPDTMYDLEGSGDNLDLGSGDEYGSGSGTGSGGGVPGGIESDCQMPPSGTFPEPAAFESDVLPEIQCHLACAEHVSC